MNRVTGVRKVSMAVGSRPKPGRPTAPVEELRRKKRAPASSSSEIVSCVMTRAFAPPELIGLTAPGAVAPEGAGDVR